MDDTQILKGILEGCVLAIINKGETYGYEILSTLSDYGFDNLIEGTLYPVLTRLQKKNLISVRVGKSPLGPKRKYYTITTSGKDYLNNFIIQYKSITSKANEVLFFKGDSHE